MVVTCRLPISLADRKPLFCSTCNVQRHFYTQHDTEQPGKGYGGHCNFTWSLRPGDRCWTVRRWGRAKFVNSVASNEANKELQGTDPALCQQVVNTPASTVSSHFPGAGIASRASTLWIMEAGDDWEDDLQTIPGLYEPTNNNADEMCVLVETPDNGIRIVCDGDVDTGVTILEAPLQTDLVRSDIVLEREEVVRYDFLTLCTTVCFALGIIMIEYGVQGLLDHYLGDSVVGGIGCIAVGLAIILNIRLSGYKLVKLFNL